MTINVVYDHQIFSAQRFGGISRYFCEIAKRVSNSSEFSANIVAPFYVNEYLRESGADISGINVPIIPKTGRIIQQINLLLAPIIIKTKKPDIVHETYYSFKSVTPKGCPTVLTIHDMINEKFSEMFPKNDTTSDAKRNAVARSNHIICISNQTRTDLIELFNVDPSKISTIHHGYSLMASDGLQSSIVFERPFLLYVGYRYPYKNFDRLLQAYGTSTLLRKEFDLIAFGGGPFNNNELSKLREFGIKTNSVRQMPGNDETLTALYKQATAFVYPSLYEGFGIPPLEAMSYSCPVICSNTSSIPEVVGNAAYLFDPYDSDAMRDSIEKVITSRDLREKLIQNGKERINLFSWNECATKTMDVYKRLI